MSTTQGATSADELQRLATDHLWLHFTRMGGDEPPIIVRGDGCYLEDSNGKRYLDALAGLFSVNLGYGFGEEIGQAALEQMRELPFYTNWSYAHPRAIELAAEVASLAPGDLNRVFFVSGGSEAVESAWKLARQYYQLRGDEARTHGRRPGCDGRDPPRRARRRAARPHATRRSRATSPTTARRSARSRSTAIAALRTPFEPLVPEVRHVAQHEPLPPAAGGDRGGVHARSCSTSSSGRSLAMGPETVCLVHMEPIQNAGGAFIAPAGYWQRRARDLRPLRHPALGRRGDHRLRAGRPLVRVGALRHPAGHHHVREGALVLVRGDRRRRRHRPCDGAVPRTTTSMYSHGITFGGHPVMSAIALKNIEIMKRERIMEHVLGNEDAFRATLEQLLDLPIVGDVRGTGFFYALELVKDKETRETFTDEECETLLRGFLSPRLFEKGLDLPGRRPRRPGDPDLAAAGRDAGGVRRDDRDPRRRPGRGLGASAMTERSTR